MPIYEYRCGACGFQKEYLQKLSDAPLKDCPECGKASLAKMVTAAGFQLKGSGWYATDFKHGQAKSKTDKPEAKGDDKPAVSADNKAADAKAVGDKPAADKPATDKSGKTEAAAKKTDAPAAKAPAATPVANS